MDASSREIHVRIQPSQRQLLEKLSADTGLTISEIVRISLESTVGTKYEANYNSFKVLERLQIAINRARMRGQQCQQ